MALLEVEDLTTYFYTEEGIVQAVDGISFEIERGETLGLVGESGAGKSVAVQSLLGLVRPPGHIVDGSIRFKGEELLDYSETELRNQVRGEEISFIFQDPMSALNPVFTVGSQISEIIEHHRDVTEAEAWDRTVELLDDVGIPDPAERADQYPHEFSGGMQQRAIIAMALSCEPDLIIADEPTTALDVTIQAQILDLFNDIQTEYDTSMIYVTHDLGVVREVCDRVSVMYLGEVAENAPYEELYRNPKHPYTQALLRSTVTADRRTEELDPIEGSMPSAIDPPSGCRYRTRCPAAFEDCAEVEPGSYEVGPDHEVSCLLYGEGGDGDPRLHETGGTGGAGRRGRTDGGLGGER
ncbi:ABC transporter ATP-binding protein [Halorussus limi]|uniref:Nickel import system ATP-binding protein NikD n=1 Tax=Halorussus limi TaxID=2938695 RepID=A0A8U0HZD8_9EURY|nr:ABC transporter ATP-binding protein [Halorussus limi]UPV76031.1 ABC transporter ATP-binding protein [Halorussus limi]